MTDCQTCALTSRRDAGDAPPWDAILRTAEWDVVHAYNTSIVGWIVLVLRRHVTSMSQPTDAEARELGPLVMRISRALEACTGCAKTYMAQFGEHPLHPHVHVHVIPRPGNLSDDQIGPGIFSRLGVAEAERVPQDRMNEVAHAVRAQAGTTGAAPGR